MIWDFKGKTITKTLKVMSIRGVLLKSNCFRDSLKRFDDDLCEYVLQFLTLNQKLLYESVCTQWRRVVFRSQTRLQINGFDGYYSLKSLVNSEVKTKYYYIFAIDNKNFESLLKKCLYIKSIEIDWKCICNEKSLTLIADNCPLLERLCISSAEHLPYSEPLLQHFGQKCGQNLKYFKTDVKFNGNFKLLLNYCSNLRSIESLNDCQKLIDINKEFLPKLQELSYLLTHDLDLQYFEVLVNKYGKRLRKLSITIKICESNAENQRISTDLNELFAQISGFSCLEYLKISLKCYFGKSFADGIRMIGQKCKQLKYFEFETYDTIILDNIFNLFENYKSLEYFSLNCRYVYKYECFISVGQTVNYGSVGCLKNCKNLTHFKLNLLYLNDKNVENIDSVFPKLKTIELKSSKSLSDISLKTIANGKHLKTLRLFCGKNITNSSIYELINKCPKLSDIYLDGLPPITTDCLNMLSTNARNNPKINYKLYYSGPPVPIKHTSVPNNLIISNFWDKHWY